MKLLDLTTRNPLLSYRHSDRARAQVRAIDELPDVLYRRLTNGKGLAFRALEEPAGEPADEKTDEFQMALEAARLEDQAYLEGISGLEGDDPNNPAILRLERMLRDRVRERLGLPPRPMRSAMSLAELARAQGLNPVFDLPEPDGPIEERHEDVGIQTLLLPERLDAKLSALRDGARRALEETGINTLFAAYGFLEWYEAPQSDKPLYAPLLLQPLEIERVSYRGHWRYFVRGTGEEATINITLAERLKQDFAIDVPKFAEEDSPENYFAKVSDVVKTQPRWRVRRFVTFGLFSFGRLVMWQDLDPERWPAGSSPSTNPVVATLLAGGAGGLGVDAPDYPIDAPEVANKLPPLILDADSSQLSAILDAADGKNLAIKGPPGTGKSQTITNLIAAALVLGKRVLFLAEKMAALDVVKSRLDNAGLGHFVFELHSTKAKKGDVLKSLAMRLEQQGKIPAPGRIDEERWELERLKRSLAQYVEVLNRPLGATGKTVQEILWAAQRAACDGLPEALDRLVLDDVEQLTERDFERGQATASGFEQVYVDLAAQWGGPDRHPWSWVEAILSPFEQQDLIAHTKLWSDAVRGACDLANEIRARLNCDFLPTIKGLASIGRVFGQLPETLPAGFSHRLLPRLQTPTARQRLAAFASRALEAQTISERCSAALSVPATVARHRELAALDEAVRVVGVGGRVAREATHICREAERECESWRAAHRSAARLAGLFGVTSAVGAGGLRAMVEAAHLVAVTPRRILAQRRPALADEGAQELIQQAARRAGELRQEGHRLGERFDLRDAGNPSDLHAAALVLQESGLFARLGGRYREAKRTWRHLQRTSRKASRLEMVNDLNAVADHLQAAAEFARHRKLTQLLEPDFDGVETDFETLRQVSDFLVAGRKLARGIEDVHTHVGTVLVSGGLEALDAIAAFGESRELGTLRTALDALSAAGAADIDSVVAGSQRKVDAAARLSTGVAEFQIAPNVKFESLEQLANDLGRFVALQAELGGLSDVQEELRALGIETSDSSLIQASLSAADALARAFSDEDAQLKTWIFSEEADQRLTLLHELSDRLTLSLDAERAARRASVELAGAAAGAFAQHLPATPLEELSARLGTAVTADTALASWTQFLKTRAEIANEGLARIVDAYGAEAPTTLADAYASVFWRSLARRAYERHPELRTFSGLSQERARQRFRAVDERLLKLNRQEIAAKLCRFDLPAGLDRGPKSDWTELALVRNQTQLQRPRIAIRDLLRRAGRAIQTLKPCWMMSPISVAQFLGAGTVDFDLVVIDEASQVRPEEAVGAIARGRQVVVVGDPMQLPPTTFFERLDGFDDDAQIDVEEESVLDQALGVLHPFRHLRWHYRSRHESLIAFSNRHFYDDRLIVFPSSGGDNRLGVKYHNVGGVYRGRGGNPDEVREVAKAAVQFMRDYPEWSLGVVTVNLEQAELLRLEIDRLTLRDERAQEYVQRWEGTLEPFFVKNLENVQGDERDCIMISTVYGPNEKGQVLQRFGPINRKTGHRRLNVLFTRAKRRVDLFTSLTAATVRDDGEVSPGVKALKGYLEYSAIGRLDSGVATHREAESDFEVFVAEALRAKGYKVAPQVGVAGFYVDLAVLHSAYPHGYLAGIECDGATYHSAKSTRDRDALRQEVLESLGWNLYRIWSTDWFSSPARELSRLVAFLDELLETKMQGEGRNSQAGQSTDRRPTPADSHDARVESREPVVSSTAQQRSVEEIPEPIGHDHSGLEPSHTKLMPHREETPVSRAHRAEMPEGEAPAQDADGSRRVFSAVEPSAASDHATSVTWSRQLVCRELQRRQESLKHPRCAKCGSDARLEAHPDGIVVICGVSPCRARQRVDIALLQDLADSLKIACFRCGEATLESREAKWPTGWGSYLLCRKCGAKNYWHNVNERLEASGRHR